MSTISSQSQGTESNVSKHPASFWDCGLVEGQRRGSAIDNSLALGIAEILARADAALAVTGERVRACPRYRALRREVA